MQNTAQYVTDEKKNLYTPSTILFINSTNYTFIIRVIFYLVTRIGHRVMPETDTVPGLGTRPGVARIDFNMRVKHPGRKKRLNSFENSL